MNKYIMAIDEGTTGVRAIIFDRDSNIVSHAYEEIPQIFPRPGWCEQEGEEIWKKCISVMKTAMGSKDIKANNIEAIGITTQRSTNLLWDKKSGKPVYNAITWHDTRTADICREMDGKGKMRVVRSLGHFTKGVSKLWDGIRMTGTGALLITASNLSFTPASALAHTHWLLDNVEGVKKKALRGEILCGTMDTWLIWKLTNGKIHATDFSNASSTGMFDSFSLKWSKMFLETFDIPTDILPEVKETAGDFGIVDKKILGVEVPIRSAVADQQSALFTEGCFNPGEVKCTNGTGSFIDMNVGSRPPASLHKLLPLIAWGIDGRVTYMLEGMINTTGSAVQWLKDNLGIIQNVEDSDDMASAVDGTEGVYFVPAFTGLSSPYWDPHACGIAVGLSRKTRKEHIVRAVLEGIVYRCKDILMSMETDSALKIASIKADGGASNNNFLLQFTADMLDIRVERPKILDGTALGAAYLAGLASDYWQSKDEVIEKRKIDRVFEPHMSEEKRDILYEGWKQAIKRSFKWRGYS
ncbi:MAG: FGGY family carbohydrate kinase [Candidatus Thermoplasmatota archaeon]|nr:FGGY family carbohydrate kinase [Candidatus Thermoplasmatota archaeon]